MDEPKPPTSVPPELLSALREHDHNEAVAQAYRQGQLDAGLSLAREATLKRLLTALRGNGEGFFETLLTVLRQESGARYALVARTLGKSLEPLALSGFEEEVGGLTLTDSPHEQVLQTEGLYLARGVQAAFPSDTSLQRYGIEAYRGQTLRAQDGSPLGLLVLLHDGALEELDETLFAAFTQAAAHELAERDHRHRLEATARAARCMRAVHSIEEAYRVALAEALSQTGARSVNILLYQEASDTLVAEYAAGNASERIRGRVLTRGEGISWRVFSSGQALFIRDSGLEPGVIYFGDRKTPGSYIGVPLSGSDGRVMGILSADAAGGERFVRLSTYDLYYLEALAGALGAALSRLEALEEARREGARFEKLAELSAQLELLDEPLRIAREALAALLPLTGFRAGGLWELQDDTLVLRVVVTAEDAVQAPFLANLPATEGLLGLALREGRTVSLENYPASPHALRRGGLLSLKTAVASPLSHYGQPYGVLGLASFEQPLPVRAETLHLTESVAHRLERALERSRFKQDLLESRENALRAIGLALEYRDYETKGHTDRVTSLAVRLAERLGLREFMLQDVRWGAYLHDTGKIAIPDRVLLKPGKLTAREWLTMQSHVLVGEQMLRQLDFIPEPVLMVVRHHHENYDGSGYPDALSGKNIPLLARIFALADVYDALTSVRLYKPAWTADDALAEMRTQAGRRFDPELWRVFESLFKRG